MGDQLPTSDMVKHTSACLGRTWRHDFTLGPAWFGYFNAVVRISTILSYVVQHTVTLASHNLCLLQASLGCLMQQLTRVYQIYVTQMTNPSTPTFKMWEIALPTPLRIDATGCWLMGHFAFMNYDAAPLAGELYLLAMFRDKDIKCNRMFQWLGSSVLLGISEAAVSRAWCKLGGNQCQRHSHWAHSGRRFSVLRRPRNGHLALNGCFYFYHHLCTFGGKCVNF